MPNTCFALLVNGKRKHSSLLGARDFTNLNGPYMREFGLDKIWHYVSVGKTVLIHKLLSFELEFTQQTTKMSW